MINDSMSLPEWERALGQTRAVLAELRAREGLATSQVERADLQRQIADAWSKECYLTALERKVRTNELRRAMSENDPRLSHGSQVSQTSGSEGAGFARSDLLEGIWGLLKPVLFVAAVLILLFWVGFLKL